MLTYPRLRQLLAGALAGDAESLYSKKVVPYLVDEWLTDYERRVRTSEVVETTTMKFSYLFDIAAGRLLAAWGVSQGRHGGARDKSRMAGHPLGAGEKYHRGHAIPHTLGGPTDINLVPQLGALNVGPFRELERKAVATPGALYFTYWKYNDPVDQKPAGVEQGLLVPGQAPMLREFAN